VGPAARLPRRRILTLIDPTQDPLGAGYHTIQSTIAVGSGGIAGKGWLHGTQTHLEFIPERHTDFIFAVFSEEFGLIGNLVLLALYALLIARGLMIAANAATFFARLLAATITLMFFTYAFVKWAWSRGSSPCRRAAALHFLRRHRAAHAVHRHRHPDERPQPPQAGADLSRRRLRHEVFAKQQEIETILRIVK